MAELAAAYPDQIVSLRQMAASQSLSVKYLEHIMTALKVAGSAQPVRGAHGGFVLTRSPTSITFREVFEALEGSLAPVHCVDDPQSCPLEEACPARDTWVEMKDALAEVLEQTTLQDLAARMQRKELQAGNA